MQLLRCTQRPRSPVHCGLHRCSITQRKCHFILSNRYLQGVKKSDRKTESKGLHFSPILLISAKKKKSTDVQQSLFAETHWKIPDSMAFCSTSLSHTGKSQNNSLHSPRGSRLMQKLPFLLPMLCELPLAAALQPGEVPLMGSSDKMQGSSKKLSKSSVPVLFHTIPYRTGLFYTDMHRNSLPDRKRSPLTARDLGNSRDDQRATFCWGLLGGLVICLS